MKKKLRKAASLIYEEFIEWMIDYIEDEVSFDTALIKLEATKSKIYSYKYDVESHFLIDEFETMETTLLLFLIASMELDEDIDQYDVIEEKLKKDLIKLINESEGERCERRKN